ncbi:hypothetical protein [uncultured Friedmanniella sp.]|uniref:hypothetical protein n=1 Tax=uncultured Friedmanniella sp. TaxID=335381 RepID=UPI0035C96797
MTATSAASAPTTGPTQTPPQTTSVTPAVPQKQRPTRSTPRQLQLLSTGAVVVGVLVGLVGALTFAFLAYTLHRAQADATQLIRVQKIQTDLLSADAAATNAFLVGGLEPAAQRAGYDSAVTDASSLIAEAARAQPADATALAALNTELVDYTASIEQARANNRQGLPVGAQYLRLASAQLRSGALPVLDELVSANTSRAAAGMHVGWGYLFPVVALLALAGFVVGQGWLARRFHRRINPGLLVASVVLAVAVIAGLAGVARLGGRVSDVRTGSFADLNAAATSRTGAYNAKANESLTLIARGSGSAFDQAWTSSAATVVQQLTLLDDPSLTGNWTAYAKVHTAIRALDNGGNWDGAVARATGSAPDSANLSFTTFDGALASVLDSANARTSTALAGQTPGLVVAAVLALLAGLAAALLGRRGIAARLREYR